MIRMRLPAVLAIVAASLSTLGPPLAAQATEGGGFSKDQLEQMVAPIALYPDNLVTAVLMAATYPLEIVEADRWLDKNKDLKGDRARRRRSRTRTGTRRSSRSSWSPRSSSA